MPLVILDQKLWFPSGDTALADGLLAIGGDISPERLLLAYKKGIFPWYDGDLPLWWCPDPRLVFFPKNVKVSKSMRSILNKGVFEFRLNTRFEEVMRNCQKIPRKEQDGTWINEDLIQQYTRLFRAGLAFSAEAWQNGHLVGGLYGVKLGKIIFGESMFTKVNNASKFAFISFVRHISSQNIRLIDCQVYTPHLESLGAELIPRKEFLQILKEELE